MRTIAYADRAEADIREVLEYLDEHSATAATRLAAEIDDRCQLLSAQPKIGRPRDEFIPGLRSSVIGRYVLFYRFTDTTFEVVRFLHGSRDIPAEFADD